MKKSLPYREAFFYGVLLRPALRAKGQTTPFGAADARCGCAFEKKRLLPQKGLCNALYPRYFYQFKQQKHQKINKLLQKNIAIFGSMWYSLNGYKPDFIILFGNYKIPIKSK